MPTKVHLVKAVVFPVVMYACESWTIKKAECQRIDVFEPWCWGRFLRVPWAAKRSNQSILKEISPEYSMKGLMLKLKLQYLANWCEELTHWRRPWCWERFKTGEEVHDRGLHGWMASLTRWTWVWVNSRSWWWTGKPGMMLSMGLQRVGYDWMTELNPRVPYFLTFADVSYNSHPLPQQLLSPLKAKPNILLNHLNSHSPTFYPIDRSSARRICGLLGVGQAVLMVECFF